MEMQGNQSFRIKQLPCRAREKFESFLSTPGIWGQEINCLHPLDWQKFYRFIRHCHRHRVKLSRSDVKELLIEANFSEQLAEYLAVVFEHGIALLHHK